LATRDGAGERPVWPVPGRCRSAFEDICNLIWKISDERLPPERSCVVPHAPPSSAENAADGTGLRAIGKVWRCLA